MIEFETTDAFRQQLLLNPKLPTGAPNSPEICFTEKKDKKENKHHLQKDFQLSNSFRIRLQTTSPQSGREADDFSFFALVKSSTKKGLRLEETANAANWPIAGAGVQTRERERARGCESSGASFKTKNEADESVGN